MVDRLGNWDRNPVGESSRVVPPCGGESRKGYCYGGLTPPTYCVYILICDELPDSSDVALNVTPLVKVNIEEYYLTFYASMPDRYQARVVQLLLYGNDYFQLGHSVQRQTRIATFAKCLISAGARSTPNCHGHVGQFQIVDS
eukprot:1608742-Pleurochrysis_carterae.AAC.4